jgi:midasin
VAELRLLQKPFAVLLERLRAILEEYPSHPVLLQIAQLCHRISALPTDRCAPCRCVHARCASQPPARSPIMKVLTGVELLLRKCEEWEAYASKRVSIQRACTG